MEGGAFLDERIQAEFKNWVMVKMHTDGRGKNEEHSQRNRKLQRARRGTIALPYYALTDSAGATTYWKGGGVIAADEFLAALQAARARFESAHKG